MKDKKEKKSVGEQRRRAVSKILATGTIASGAGFVAPTSWKKPLVNAVSLPAHAQTTIDSGDSSGSGDDQPLNFAGQIGSATTGGLLDMFMSPAYAIIALNDLIGGCIAIHILGTNVTAEVTLNTGATDSKSGSLSGNSFSIDNVHGYMVSGSLDNASAPTTCSGYVGSEMYNAAINGSCSIIPPATTTPSCEGTACPT